MSTRRAARAPQSRRPAPTSPRSTVPVVFKLGLCLEVWATEDVLAAGLPGRGLPHYRTGRERHRAALDAWQLKTGHRPAAGCGLWSIHDDPITTTERLAALGLTPDDLPTLRAEATALLTSLRGAA